MRLALLSSDDVCRSTNGGRSKGLDVTGKGRQSVHSHISKQCDLKRDKSKSERERTRSGSGTHTQKKTGY